MRYQTLLNVLDKIRDESTQKFEKKYLPPDKDPEKINQARSRAFIHLYLKVMFGLSDFSERENQITDGAYDGGIDGYHIDSETKIIYLIQSKFRTNSKNFENKEIELDELLCMDISRILDGEVEDEVGNKYNGKIMQFQREVSSLPDVARYSYRVAILANLRGILPSKLKQLTGGYSAEVFDFESTYRKLVFPIITGTYFTASDIVIPIDLSNKNSGSKISYNVKTKYGECEITVLFVPTMEIAKIMNKYRNSILKNNPRSYLDLEGRSVNAAIRSTIVESETNEFALYNNGITMLSEETNINEKIGQKNKAQLRIKNPQIINGGQTSFTLSRILLESGAGAEKIFEDKEVLLKVITLLDGGSSAAKLELIDEISNATNKQTQVINADRFANEKFHIDVQKMLFDTYGLLYERKRGEFSAGVNDGYVSVNKIIERNHFWRIYYASLGRISKGNEKRLVQKNQFSDIDVEDKDKFDRAVLALEAFAFLSADRSKNAPLNKNIYAKIFLYVEMFISSGLSLDNEMLDNRAMALENSWSSFVKEMRSKTPARKKAYIDPITGDAKIRLSESKSDNFAKSNLEIEQFVKAQKTQAT